jgi:hypothetical protein
MRKLGLALLSMVVLGLGISAWGPPLHAENTVGPSNAILCNRVANVPAGVAVATQIVAGVPGQSIFVCGYQISNTASAGTFTLSFGTGSTCTTPTTLVTAQNVSNNAPATYNVGVAQMQTTSGATLCITPSVVTIATTIWFSQF